MRAVWAPAVLLLRLVLARLRSGRGDRQPTGNRRGLAGKIQERRHLLSGRQPCSRSPAVECLGSAGGSKRPDHVRSSTAATGAHRTTARARLNAPPSVTCTPLMRFSMISRFRAVVPWHLDPMERRQGMCRRGRPSRRFVALLRRSAERAAAEGMGAHQAQNSVARCASGQHDCRSEHNQRGQRQHAGVGEDER